MGKKFTAILSTLALSSTAFLAAAGTVGVDAAGAATFSVNVPLSCLVSDVPVIGSQTASRNQPITTTTSVSQVFQNGTYSVAISPDPGNESSDLGSGATLKNIRNLHYRTTVPPNAKLVGSATLSGGSGLNSTPSITSTPNGAAGTLIEVTVPGPINAGTNYQLPTVNETLQAVGPALSVIQPRIYGTSYSDWGLSMTVNADLPSGLGNNDLSLTCFPSSSLALSTTTIYPTDLSAPSISITSPADGASYAQGAAVNAAYSCSDGPFGTGVATCAGPTSSGTPIDTSTIGPHTFVVTSTDVAGNGPSSSTVSYTVSDDPAIVAKGGWADEGPSAVVPFTVRLSQPAAETTTVHYATADGTATAADDYNAISGDLTFSPGGSQVQTVNVGLKNDSSYEPTETLALNLSSPVNAIVATPSANGRIRDDEVPQVRVEGGVTTENSGSPIPFKVSIEGPTKSNITVNYATSNGSSANNASAGSDYTNTSGALTFIPGGELVQTVNVLVTDDTVFEADAESFVFTATNSGNSQSATAPGTIVDNEAHPPVMSISDSQVIEGDTASKAVMFTVSLVRVSAAPVTARFSTTNGTATAGSDYTAQTNKQIVIEAGKTSKTIAVPIFGDTLSEADETFTLTLSQSFAAALGVSSATGTIVNDDTPSIPTPVISVGNVSVAEGDSGTAIISATVSLNVKSATTVTARFGTIAGTASAGSDYKSITGKLLTFLPGGFTKRVSVAIVNDLAIEGNEAFTLALTSITGATAGHPLATVTILDNDNPLPTAPSGLTATTSRASLGGVELSWTAATVPLADWPITTYQYRVSTDGGTTYGAWAPTDDGTSTFFVHACGQGVACTYEVRALNKKGTSAAAPQAPSATGLIDTALPSVSIESPTNRGNLDTISSTLVTGDAGIDGGDTGTIPVNVYPCNNCTNITPTYSASVTPNGGTWSASPSLAPGVYTVQATQTDWNSQTATTNPVTFEVRNAVFVSPFGSDASAGTVTAPKATVAAAVATAGAQNRPQVAVSAGTYSPASGTTIAANVSVLGGFDQFSGWSRPGTAGATGTPNRSLTKLSGAPQGVFVNGASTVTLDGLTVNGLNSGLGAGASVYGVRVVGASAGSPANVTLTNTKVTAAAGKDGTNSTTPGANSTAVGCTGAGHSTYTQGNGSSCNPGGGGFGGGGGSGGVFSGNPGNAGGTGSGTGGGAGGATANPAGGGNGGNGGAAGSSGSSGTNDAALAGATWLGRSGGNGGGGATGGGGGGGGGGTGGGIGQSGGRGAGGGGGGGGGGGAGAGTYGGGSFAAYAFNANLTITNSSLTADVGGSGGSGAVGGNAAAAGNGGTTGAQFFAGNAGGGGGGGGGAGGGGGGGGAGGPSIAAFRTGAGSITVSGSTLQSAGAPAGGGTGGNGGNGGGAGVGGTDTSDTACQLLCGAINVGKPGGAGPSGGNGTAGAFGMTCTKFDGSTCTP